MNSTLIQTVKNLPLEDKLELLDVLFEQIEPLEEVLSESEQLIVLNRLERIEQDPRPAKPWREFLKELE